MKFIYNLQFFAEDTDNDNTESNTDSDNDSTGEQNNEIDTSAFADLISEKDKQIASLQEEVAKLKKTSADLLVKISNGNKPEKSFEENLLSLVGAKPRKE